MVDSAGDFSKLKFGDKVHSLSALSLCAFCVLLAHSLIVSVCVLQYRWVYEVLDELLAPAFDVVLSLDSVWHRIAAEGKQKDKQKDKQKANGKEKEKKDRQIDKDKGKHTEKDKDTSKAKDERKQQKQQQKGKRADVDVGADADSSDGGGDADSNSLSFPLPLSNMRYFVRLYQKR